MKKNLLSILFTGIFGLASFGAWAQIVFLVNEPSNLAGSYNFTYSSANGWGADMDTVAITAEAAFAYDGTAADSLACEAVVNTSEIEGKIAVLYRGACNFSLKAKNVQDSGAVACVIINNVSGGPVGMGGGTLGPDVYIPVVMLGDVDGAALRDSIIAGGVEIFLGNNTGLFADNLGSYANHIGMANSQSIPTQFAMSSTDFSVPIGAWVHNYGSAEGANVVVNGVIDRDGSEVYNETSSAANVPVGDSLYFSLPEYSEANGYDPGYYTITYTISSDATDEFPDDNVASAGFWINEEGTYSKSRVDPVEGPQGSNGLRPANSTEYQWCIAMQSQNASAMQVTGVTFNTLGSQIDLTSQAVQLAVYEWNDPVSSTSVTFDDLNELTDNEFYDYASDLQGEFVTHDFADPVELLDDQKYLVCATIFVDDMFLGVDQQIDYTVNYENYLDEVFFPLNDIDGSTWYAGGFGPENVPAIIANLELVNGIAENIEERDVTPYPNPTVDMINIPFGTMLNGDVNLNVYDVEGRLVMSEGLCLKNTNKLSLDVAQLSSGLHTFNLTFEDNSTTSFRVVITK